MMFTPTPAEDGGLGALIVAIVWLLVEWWKSRKNQAASR